MKLGVTPHCAGPPLSFSFLFIFRGKQVDEMVAELVQRNVEPSYVRLVKEIVRVSKRRDGQKFPFGFLLSDLTSFTFSFSFSSYVKRSARGRRAGRGKVQVGNTHPSRLLCVEAAETIHAY